MKTLEVGKFYYMIAEEKYPVWGGEPNIMPERVEVIPYKIPFTVLNIEATNLETDEELELDSDITLRDPNGVLRHNEFDIDISLNFGGDYDIDEGEALDNFVLIEDKEEIEKLQKEFKKYDDYVSQFENEYPSY